MWPHSSPDGRHADHWSSLRPTDEDMRPITERLHLALSRHGAVGLRDHPELESVIRSHVRRGLLTAVLPGVYTPPDPSTDALIAAVRQWDPDAIICGRAAARSTFAPEMAVRDIEVATRRRPGVHHPRLRFSRRRIPPELQLRGHTHPTVTAVDLAATDGGEAICSVLRTRSSTISHLQQVVDDLRRIGNRLRRAVIAASATEPWSVAERSLHQLLARRNLPEWCTNHAVRIAGHTHYIDVAFRQARIAIEIDGFQYHSSRDQFEADRDRQNRLVLAGWTVLRFTWRMLTDHPQQVIRAILSALEQRVPL